MKLMEVSVNPWSKVTNVIVAFPIELLSIPRDAMAKVNGSNHVFQHDAQPSPLMVDVKP